MPLSGLTAFGELGILFIATLPLGYLLLRGIEYFCRQRFQLSILERVLLAPYLAVGLLYVIAAVPVPIYTASLVIGLLLAGTFGVVALWVLGRAPGLDAAVKWFTKPVGILLILGTVGLLSLEIFSTGTHSFPNSYDGSFQSLYVKLIVTDRSLPWTLQPYAASGVTYPQQAAVWMTLPVLLFGWPIQSAPVAVPPFFLGLSACAAFCWGSRLGGLGSQRGTVWGLLFAACYGLIVSWPRLFIGGSYDFAFCLPLFLVALGWLRPFVESHAGSWRNVIAFGGLVGLCTSLSLAVGETLVIFLIAWIVVFGRPLGLRAAQWLGRVGLILGIAALFVIRSIIGVAVWFQYPSHTLSAVGNPPQATVPGLPAPTLGTFLGELDPFVPFKWKLSPITILSVELAILLAIGLAILVVWWLARPTRLCDLVSESVVRPLTMGCLLLFVWTLFLIVASGVPALASVFDSLASLYESSFLLFIFYQTIALVPLIILVEWTRRSISVRTGKRTLDTEVRKIVAHPATRRGRRLSSPRTLPVVAGILLVVPLAIGTGATVTQVPGFLSSHLNELSNVSQADVDALEWVGTHLPECSVVLVGPGSAGQFLPLYATVHIDFPMMPLSANLSYNQAVANLTAGIYTGLTSSALTSLGITDVFVSGQTSVSYPPLDPQPLLDSPDFSELFHESDAYVFAFLPGVHASGCVET